jgi:hypothetical protein
MRQTSASPSADLRATAAAAASPHAAELPLLAAASAASPWVGSRAYRLSLSLIAALPALARALLLQLLVPAASLLPGSRSPSSPVAKAVVAPDSRGRFSDDASESCASLDAASWRGKAGMRLCKGPWEGDLPSCPLPRA